jgi:nucleoside-diphosphate-sugar epimerase
MAYILLTGATGFLGRYILKDCLLAEVPVAVLIRPNKRETAQQRLEAVLGYWDQRLARSLPRPVMIEGDVREAHSGVDQRGVRWIAEHCDTIVHSAASMNFHASTPEGEPYHSNVEGTKNLLALCEAAGIRHFHQVSTAYICGLRSGVILESELDLGQTNGNDYERSKLAAEKLIRQAPFLETKTFYRPASIIGDSESGYTTNYHGFYSPLQVLYSMAKGLLGRGEVGRQIIDDVVKRARFMDRLNLKGDEGKNLVPVDWVAAVLVHILLRPELHNRTYHLTPHQRTTVQLVRDVLEVVLRDYAGISDATALAPIEVPAAEREAIESVFRDQMSTYDSHWRDDPVFDCTNTLAAAPHLPSPTTDRAMLERTARFAVDGNFGWPRPLPVQIKNDAAQNLLPLVRAADGLSVRKDERRIGLQVLGQGGGQWSLVFDGAAPLAARPGLESDCLLTCHLSSQTFSALAGKQVSVEQAVYSGSVIVEGPWASDRQALDVLQNVVAVPKG